MRFLSPCRRLLSSYFFFISQALMKACFLFIILSIFTISIPAGAEDYFTMRDGLPSFMEKLRTKDDAIRIMYFGGAITVGDGIEDQRQTFREKLTDWFRKDNPGAPISPFNCSLSYSGSWLGAYRYWDDVGYFRPGLVIVEFAVDDDGLPEDQVIASMEGIVRKIRERTPSKPDILFIYTLHENMLAALNADALPAVIQYHEKVAEHYGIPSVILAKAAADKIRKGQTKLETFIKGGASPTVEGHAAYFETLRDFFTAAKAVPAKASDKKLPVSLSKHSLQDAKLITYDWATLDDKWLGWQLSEFKGIPHVAVSEQPGATITLKFKGSEVGYYNLIGPDTGDLEYRLNGGDWQLKKDWEPRAAKGTSPNARSLVSGLDRGKEHILELRIAPNIPQGSKGRFCRLGWFLVDGVVTDPTAGLDPLDRIDAIYAGMKPITWQPSADRWLNLERTKTRLKDGPSLNMVLLGDSIIGDTSSSNFELLLGRDYPKCQVKKTLSVRGSTGCWWYKDENRVEEYVLRHQPDLLVIGGISQRDDIEAIRSVIHQCRAKLPDLEVLLVSPVFGAPQDPHNKHWAPKFADAAHPYRANLAKLAQEEKCGFFDMTGPWWEYIQSSGFAVDSFKRDVVHANARGSQIIGRLMQQFLKPGE